MIRIWVAIAKGSCFKNGCIIHICLKDFLTMVSICSLSRAWILENFQIFTQFLPEKCDCEPIQFMLHPFICALQCTHSSVQAVDGYWWAELNSRSQFSWIKPYTHEHSCTIPYSIGPGYLRDSLSLILQDQAEWACSRSHQLKSAILWGPRAVLLQWNILPLVVHLGQG